MMSTIWWRELVLAALAGMGTAFIPLAMPVVVPAGAGPVLLVLACTALAPARGVAWALVLRGTFAGMLPGAIWLLAAGSPGPNLRGTISSGAALGMLATGTLLAAGGIARLLREADGHEQAP